MYNVFCKKQEAQTQYEQNHKSLSENRGSLSKVEDKSHKIHFSYAYRLFQIIRKHSKGLRKELIPVQFILMTEDISRTALFLKK